MSPRRSVRARTSQPSTATNQHTNSSTSSTSSGRAERSTRSHHKNPSPQRSKPRSQSLGDQEEPAKPPPRRTRSGLEEVLPVTSDVLEDEDEDGEEGVTRCICGNTEYPGLPVLILGGAKKDGNVSDLVAEDTGGMFIQCDTCKVWQHGGCVGILSEEMSPEEYYCEECRKELHKLATTAKGCVCPLIS